MALWHIHDTKALGLDGCNSLCFKKVWCYVKHDFYKAILSFLEHVRINHRVNLTCITLIPKVVNAD